MPLLVAAIDFGTTYSGWAFSFKHEFERDPTKISAQQWTGGQLVSNKGPTCVLIKGDGKTIEAFGFEAESKYAEYAEEKCHEQYYFFKRFKMELYGRIGIERNLLIEDTMGKKLPAITVFALSIRFLMDNLLDMSKKRIVDDGLTNDDIHWVLTVPAIWDDAAKQFMREAAQQAGISSDKLTIALEPEAASIFCRYLQIEKAAEGQSTLSTLRSGSKYLVLDAGGGTVDITVHEVALDGSLKELHKASGGEWGGTKVDKAFEDFLDNIAGDGTIAKFKQNHMDDYIDLLRDFEVKKREIKPNMSSKIAFRIPVSLADLVKEKTSVSFKEYLNTTEYRDRVTLVSDKMKITGSVAESFFKTPVQNIVDHVQELFRESKIRGCSTILMVGGFSESLMLQSSVEQKFPSMKLIIPNEAGLVVLKGAVIFGHRPNSISERVCKWTYGVKSTHKKSDACKHPPGRVYTDENGDLRCEDIFACHVEEGTTVKLGEKQRERIFGPVYDDQSCIAFQIYASSSREVNFVTEKCCRNIGSVTVDIPDRSSGRNRKFGTTFMFGGTEIKVSVEDKATGQFTEKFVNFLG